MRENSRQEGQSCLLWDADRLDAVGPEHFDPAWWQQQDLALHSAAGGRGSALFVAAGNDENWVLRHYRRGGMIARLVEHSYVYTGMDRSRAFSEWRLLATMQEKGLPVPAPVAARVRRAGLVYHADLLTVAVPDSVTLHAQLGKQELSSRQWQTLGRLVARFHAMGVDHHDLNAHNILVDAAGEFTLIDFDKSRLRTPGKWGEANLARLRRSLDKLSGARVGYHFSSSNWQSLLAGYLHSS